MLVRGNRSSLCNRSLISLRLMVMMWVPVLPRGFQLPSSASHGAFHLNRLPVLTTYTIFRTTSQCSSNNFPQAFQSVPTTRYNLAPLIWRRKWQPTLVFLLENPMNRGTWQAIVHGVARVGHNLVTKPPAPLIKSYCSVTHASIAFWIRPQFVEVTNNVIQYCLLLERKKKLQRTHH